MESDLFRSGTAELVLQDLNLIISVMTFAACVYVVPVMLYWWIKLRSSTTNLRPLILGIAAAKFGLGFWALSQIIQIVFYDVELPTWSLAARLCIMLAVFMHVWVTVRIKPAPKTESIPGPFHRE